MSLIGKEEIYLQMQKAKAFGELTAKSALRLVKTAPTVDAVEVVRCKDCKSHGENHCCNGGIFDACVIFTEDGNMFTDDNDFCSYGKRKEAAHETI